MGTDIHIRVEQFTDDGWVERESSIKEPCWACKETGKDSKRPGMECFWCKGTGIRHVTDWFDGRNYTLFALLAGIRNYYDIQPLSPPRGIPDDACEEWRRYVNDTCHSASWLLVEEIASAPWDKPITMSGFVCAEVYRNFRDNGGDPLPRSGGVGGAAKRISNKEMDDLLLKTVPGDPKLQHVYTEVKWKEILKSECQWFYEKTLPALVELRQEGKPVRMLFAFDS